MPRTMRFEKALQKGRQSSPDVDDGARADGPTRAMRQLERIKALEEAEYLLSATLEHMDQGLVLLDKGQTVRLCNPRAHELLRLSEDILNDKAAFGDIRAFQKARGDFSLMPPSISSVSAAAMHVDFR